MSAHEKCVGETDEWFTPPEIFGALKLMFDLDPCQPNDGRAFLSVPCRHFLTACDDGLAQPWHGLVWMNPPFGARNGVVPWLRKFFTHGNGIGLVAARTSAGWFQDWMPMAGALLFPRGKTKFIRSDGSVGKSPGTGVVLFSSGAIATSALVNSGLGMLLTQGHGLESWSQ
jgi:hypothetical protein